MDGKPYNASHFAATLRRHLWREHLGLLPPQEHDATSDPNAQPPSESSPNKILPGPEDDFVADPLSDKLWRTWTEQATTNTEVFRDLFHADPDDAIRTFDDYETFLPAERSVRRDLLETDDGLSGGDTNPAARTDGHHNNSVAETADGEDGDTKKLKIKQGHLWKVELSSAEVKEQLDRIRGHLVWMPLRFLEDAEMAEKGLQVNEWTESIYT